MHRDLALRNVFVKKNKIIRIGDFGLARHNGDKDYYKFDSLLIRSLLNSYFKGEVQSWNTVTHILAGSWVLWRRNKLHWNDRCLVIWCLSFWVIFTRSIALLRRVSKFLWPNLLRGCLFGIRKKAFFAKILQVWYVSFSFFWNHWERVEN